VRDNRTHRTRLARELATAAGIGYQQALTRVIRAGDAGLLTYPLDAAGMRRALAVLLPGAADAAPAATGTPAFALEPRYYRLVEACGGRLQPGVQQRIAKAARLGVAAARSRGRYDPVAIIDVDWVDDDFDTRSDWWRRAATAGSRPDCALPDPYPPGSQPDGHLPIDRALDTLDATGDLDTYEATLRSLIRREPRDVDAHAHLGNLYFDMADPGSVKIAFPEPPDKSQQRTWLRTALGHYQSAVGIAELALPEPFTGVLPWTELDNRPFLRALHGTAITLWRLRRTSAAAQILLDMLWINPADNQGAREMLGNVREHRAWEDADY
jgi:hypothetical protein